MKMSNEEAHAELASLPVQLHLTFAESVVMQSKLEACGCISCLALADRIVSVMSDVLLESDLTPELSALADQSIARDRTEIRLRLLGMEYLSRRKPQMQDMTSIDRIAKRLKAVINELDMSLPLDELRSSVLAVADADAMQWGIDPESGN